MLAHHFPGSHVSGLIPDAGIERTLSAPSMTRIERPSLAKHHGHLTHGAIPRRSAVCYLALRKNDVRRAPRLRHRTPAAQRCVPPGSSRTCRRQLAARGDPSRNTWRAFLPRSDAWRPSPAVSKSLLTMLWRRVASDAIAVSGLGILWAGAARISRACPRNSGNDHSSGHHSKDETRPLRPPLIPPRRARIMNHSLILEVAEPDDRTPKSPPPHPDRRDPNCCRNHRRRGAYG